MGHAVRCDRVDRRNAGTENDRYASHFHWTRNGHLSTRFRHVRDQRLGSNIGHGLHEDLHSHRCRLVPSPGRSHSSDTDISPTVRLSNPEFSHHRKSPQNAHRGRQIRLRVHPRSITVRSTLRGTFPYEWHQRAGIHLQEGRGSHTALDG